MLSLYYRQLVLLFVLIAKQLNHRELKQIKETEKKYECIIFDKATKQQQETEAQSDSSLLLMC